MATDRPTPPEGVDLFDGSGDDDDDVPTIDLDPGEVLEGTVLDVYEGENEYGPWYRLTVKDPNRDEPRVRYFAKDDVRKACRKGLIEPGTEVWIARDTEQEEFTNDDGEDREYFPTAIGFPGGPA